jgi:hypothetical protein
VSLDEPAWSGQHVCLALSKGNAISLLQQHAQCKNAKLRETCAVVLVPEAVRTQSSPLLAHMHCLGQHPMRADGSKDWVYGDDPAELPGAHAVDLLPEAIEALRTMEPSGDPELTFVFESKVADLRCICSWDSGATRTFMSARFPQRHDLAVQPDTRTIVLADGSEKETMGTCSLKLQIQKHHRELVLSVMDIENGFDVILGNDWSRAQPVEAKFCPAGPKDSHIYLR